MSLDRFENFVIDHETLVQLAEACKAYRRICGTAGNWYGIQDMSCVNAPGRQWYLRIAPPSNCFQPPEVMSQLTEFAGPWASAEDCFYAATKAEWLVAQDSDTVEHFRLAAELGGGLNPVRPNKS